jgi:lysophospholipase L1-like esterase
MAAVMPSYNDLPAFDAMACEDEVDIFDRATAAILGTGVVSGCLVTQDTGTDMKVAVSSGQVAILGTLYTYAGTGGSPLVVPAASAGTRRDTVVLRLAAGSVTAVLVEGTVPTGLTGSWTRNTPLSTCLTPQKGPMNWSGTPVSTSVNYTTDAVCGEVVVDYNTTAITGTTTTIIAPTTGNIVDKTNPPAAPALTGAILKALGSDVTSLVPQYTSVGQDASGQSGSIGAGTILNTPQVGTAQVGAASIGATYNTLTTLTLAPGTNTFPSPNGPTVGPSGTTYEVAIPTSGGTPAGYIYTGSQGNVLTGLTYSSGGSGTIVAGTAGFAYGLSTSLYSPIVDVIWGDSIAVGQGGSFGPNAWLNILCAMENAEAGLPAPGQGLILPYGVNEGIYGSFEWSGAASITQTATATNTTTTLTLPSVTGIVNGMQAVGAGITSATVTGIAGNVVTIAGTIPGPLTTSSYTFSWATVTGSPKPGIGLATPGSAGSPSTATLFGTASISDNSQTFRRALVYWLAQPNGEKITVATTGGTSLSSGAIDTHVQTASVTLTATSNQVSVASGGFPGAAIGDTVTVYSGTGTIPAGTTILSINANTMYLSNPVSGTGTATIAYQGFRCFDTFDKSSVNGTSVTVTCSAHSVGTGAAGCTVVALEYLNTNGSNGSIVHNLGVSGAQTGDWAPTGSFSAGAYAWLNMLVANGTPPRRVILCMGGNDQPGFFDSSNTPATMAANLTAVVQGIQAVSSLIEVVVTAEYTAGSLTAGNTVSVGGDVWVSQWVPAMRQVAVTTGATFVDMYERFGNCTAHRQVTDLVLTEGSPNISSATAAFTLSDNGSYVIAPGLPPGTQMTFTSSTAGVMTNNSEVGGTGIQAIIGGDPYNVTVDNGFHFGPHGQRGIAELFGEKLEYSKAQGAGANSSPTFATVTAKLIQAGSNTSQAASYGPVTGIVSGTKFQLPVTSQDSMVYVNVATTTTLTSVTIGPTTGAEANVYTTSIGSQKTDCSFRVPAGWFVIITAGTIGDLDVTYVLC